MTPPPLVSRALGARAATRAAPVVALLVGLFLADAIDDLAWQLASDAPEASSESLP